MKNIFHLSSTLSLFLLLFVFGQLQLRAQDTPAPAEQTTYLPEETPTISDETTGMESEEPVQKKTRLYQNHHFLKKTFHSIPNHQFQS